MIKAMRNGLLVLLAALPLLANAAPSARDVVQQTTDKLLAEGSFTQAEMDEIVKGVTDTFDDAWDKADAFEVPNDVWLGTQGADSPWQKLITPRQVRCRA